MTRWTLAGLCCLAAPVLTLWWILSTADADPDRTKGGAYVFLAMYLTPFSLPVGWLVGFLLGLIFRLPK